MTEMNYGEYKEGTGIDSQEEFDLAQKFYVAMPDSFTKEDLYRLRKAMSEVNFKDMCRFISYYAEQYESMCRLREKSNFVNDMIATLKDECKLDVIGTYAAYRADKAMIAQRDSVNNAWEEFKGF